MNVTDRNFNKLVISALAFGFIALTLAGGMALWTVSQNEGHERLVERTIQISNTIGRYQLLLERAETARRGYLLDQSQRFLPVYSESTDAIPATLGELESLIDDPRQKERLTRLRTLTDDEIGTMNESMRLARSGDVKRAQAIFDEDQSLRALFAIRKLSQQMTETQDALLRSRDADQQQGLTQLYLVLGGAGLLLLLIGLGSGWAIRRYIGDLATARDRLHLLNADLEGAVRARTAQLQLANDEIQRFAYIVSHDLRSPLVNIMGFTAELNTASNQLSATIDRVDEAQPGLIDEAARLAVKEDLPEAVGFIRSSSQKMDRLINAILHLSREGRRSLKAEHLPMERVVAEIIASFEQQLTVKDASVGVKDTLPDITSDRVAVEQILSNLIENAIKYGRSDGTGEVEVRGERKENDVIFSVSDNGRGIAPSDHERIFDLFRRSGKQDQAGEGLGLAHVRALAYRLGGNVTIDSALGEGSTFRLILPATYFDREAAA